ncbi:MAG: 6-phosphogluconolactonase [Methylomonas sp.]|nr:6-phosphogluconolactonase [Methylomonas sp.]PPD20399.1 MAG: 6-phosphogluconolactonase [Methylomonas sp.]PPD25680.1 MAG: 6-phosphogluconolactonase [Methylomonas sp.]PPD36657.1 MAG: 6-phosphogluconolactonase [Methylomonas sp.]PPD40550.1 MAG: 6-phosphogluconolactonase [Methylomonas sp.]
MMKEFFFEQRHHLINALVAECQDVLAEALSKHGVATLLVSGGTTPAPLYEALSKADLNWKKIKIALVDERWVDASHNASNEALIRRTLLTNNARTAEFIGMKTAAATAAEGQKETEANYRKLPQPFSLVLVGMGGDGHTASLFPKGEGTVEALRTDNDKLTTAIKARQSEITGANTERLSMTVAGLLKSERIIILFTGEDKLAVFNLAQKPGPVEELPIRALIHQTEVPVELYWAP